MFTAIVRKSVANISKSSCNTRYAPSMRYLGTYKTTTGLPGLDVDVNARDNLISLSNSVLESVKRVPEGAAYRENVEQWFTFIQKTAAANEDFKKIEDEINLGQIEEVIEMAKSEMELIDFYVENKVWEQVAVSQADAESMYADLKENILMTSSPDSMTSVNKTPSK